MTTTRWTVKKTTYHNLKTDEELLSWYVDVGNNRTVLCPDGEIAAQIVAEHNAHAALVEALKIARQYVVVDAMEGLVTPNKDLEVIDAALRLASGDK